MKPAALGALKEVQPGGLGGARSEESSPWRLKGGEVWTRVSLGLKEGSLDLSGGLSLELVG